MAEWGSMSLLTDGSTPFMRRPSELLWVLSDKSDNKFSRVPIDFPPMVLFVFDRIFHRGAFSNGVQAIQIEENFGTDPHNFGDVRRDPLVISVKHLGEIISTNAEMTLLINMFAEFPPSYYELEVNNPGIAKMYKQMFTPESGKLKPGQPITMDSEDKMSWTKVTFKPDLRSFNISYDGLNIGRTIWKRAIDIAGTLGHLKVTLSGIDLNMENFAQYVDRWYPQFVLEKRLDAPKRVHENVTKGHHKWEVSVSRSNGQFEHISFINGLPTARGGSHVELVKKTLTHYALEVKKNHGVGFDMDDVCLFINLIIPGVPSSKNDKFLEFPSNYNLEFSTEFVEKFTQILRGLGPVPLSVDIPDLIDATEAGGELSDQCYLILTEGESAKKFALTGHGKLGIQFYGLLPMRGKIPNAKRNDSNILDREAVKNIIASLGLEMGACYSSAKKLRYGHLMLMMDQDHDGSHIKGLVINFIHTFWPSLLKFDFLSHFVTPVIKVQANNDFLEFYSITEYDIWARDHNDKHGSVVFTAVYYKGLASHDPDDVKEYMIDKLRHVKTFKYSGPQDFNAIDLAFSENRVYDRRQWILTFEAGTFLDPTPESITYSDFFNEEFILYSIEDTRRSIPSMVDGLKPSQRKALFTALKINLKRQKVDTFAGEVCKECEYHHGQDNMSDTIVGMAQKYPGTNNINLFVPKGIFGSRREGTKTGARYLSVRVSPVTRYIFRKEDDALLSPLVEEGKPVQPDWFLPVIPMALVNGCEGIATGWNTKVTKYSPFQIIKHLKHFLAGKNSELKKLIPWYNGFKGEVRKRKGFEGSFVVRGVVIVESLKVQITELPIETKFDKFKRGLDLLKKKEKIKSYHEEHDDENINFVVEFTKEQFEAAQKQGFLKLFKLVSTISTDNMHLIDEKGLLAKYSSADEILSNFFDFRLPFYEKRKKKMSEQYKERIKMLENIKRYIVDCNGGKFSMKLSVRMNQLRDLGYDSFDNFNYIRELKFYDLDPDNIKEIDRDCSSIKEELEKLEMKTASDLWMADLAELKQKLTLFYAGKISEDPEFRPRKRQRTGP